MTIAAASPRVTCIMPTFNRRRFVPRAIEYFFRQDYVDAELVIVDDGTDRIGDLVGDDPRVRYVELPSRIPLGAKRNRACEEARGDIIVHWDDDDWQSPRRIRYQVDALLEREADVCGLKEVLFYDCRDRSAWAYHYPASERFWLYGSSFCYRRAFWERHRFADVRLGEDTRFIWEARDARMFALPDTTCQVSIVHGANTSPHATSGSFWRPHDAAAIRAIVGSDMAFYDGGATVQVER